MKKLLKDGKIKFVADALVPGYKKQGWVEEGEKTPPPQHDSDDGQAAPEGHTAENPDDAEDQDNAFVCPECGKSYKTEAGLAKHMAEKHPQA